jgi:PAS domain S-box-containing protein
MGIRTALSKFSGHYLVMPGILVVFFLLFQLIYTDLKERTIEEFNNEQLILAETGAQGISSFFTDHQSDLKFLSQLTEIQNRESEAGEILSDYYSNHKSVIEAITLVDEHGVIRLTYPENQAVIGRNITYQKHVQEILKTHKPVISDVFQAAQGYRAIAMHVPIFREGHYTGSLAMLISIDKLGKLYLGKIKIRGTGKIWLLSANGIELYCPVEGHTGQSFLENTRYKTASLKLLEKIRTHSKGTVTGVHQGIQEGKSTVFHEKFIVFYRAPLDGTYWTILISFHDEDIYVALSKLRIRLIVVFALMFLIIAYYFYSLANVRKVFQEQEKRKQAERSLRESEENFRTMFEASPIGIEFYRADGQQMNANPASLSMFGLRDVTEVLEFNLFEGTTLDQEKIQQLRRGKPVSYQAKFDFDKVRSLNQYQTTKSGIAYFEYIITPLIHHSTRAISGYLVQIQDISERKRSEEDIQVLAQALRSVNECVSITDLDNKILFVNEAFLRTYGYDREDLIGKPITTVRIPEDHSAVLDEILPATLEGEWKGELMNCRKDGTRFPIYLSTTMIRDKSGIPMGLVGVASDITQRKKDEADLIRAKNRAEESDRLKTAFLANMSHEIRTPMNGILGFAALLKETDLTREEHDEFIRMIEKSGDRMLHLLNNIVDISKIEAGLMDISYLETNVGELFEFICRFFQPEAEGKGLTLTCRNLLSHDDRMVITDREKLYAILTNLVKNAVKYTRQGLINMQVKRVGDMIEFEVRDTGIGIPHDRHQAVFERFIQAEVADKMARQGAGLGLSITKAYVEMLGGAITLESEPGKGSVFTFTIPVKKKS